jgi:hypothetical protein
MAPYQGPRAWSIPVSRLPLISILHLVYCSDLYILLFLYYFLQLYCSNICFSLIYVCVFFFICLSCTCVCIFFSYVWTDKIMFILLYYLFLLCLYTSLVFPVHYLYLLLLLIGHPRPIHSTDRVRRWYYLIVHSRTLLHVHPHTFVYSNLYTRILIYSCTPVHYTNCTPWYTPVPYMYILVPLYVLTYCINVHPSTLYFQHTIVYSIIL